MKEQLIEEIERLRQEVDKLRREKTELKKAEEELHASEEQYRNLFDSAPEAITLVGFDGTILDVNNASEIITGLPREEIIGKRFTELGVVHEKDLPKYTEALSQLASGESIQPYEVELTFKGKKRRWFEVFSSLLKKDDKPYAVQVITRDITERKKAEQELEAGRKKLESYIESMVDGVVICDLTGNTVDINKACLELLGYKRKTDVVGRSGFIRSISNKDMPKMFAILEEIIKKRYVKDREITVLTQDKKEIPILFSATSIEEPEGKPTSIFAIFKDITERKRAEQELRQSGEKYRTTLENVVEGYYENDLAGNFTLVNDAICRNMGYSRDELLGMNNRDYMDEQTARKVLEKFAEVYTTGIPARGFEFEVIRKDGTKLVTSSSVSLIMDSQGQPTGFRGVVRDVTVEKKAEEALRESEGKYRAILENIEDGYFEVDLVGNFTFVNDSLCRIHGYTRDETIGINNRQYMDEKTAKRVYQLFNKIYTTGKPSKGADWEITRKDGTKRFIDGSVSLIRDAQGKRIGFRGIARDITERKEAEQAQRQNEAKYRTILESIEHGYFEVDIRGNLTFFNDSTCEILGYSRDELLGMNNRDYMDEQTAKKVYQTFNRIYTTGKPDRGFDWEIIRKDGTKRTVEASVFLVRDSEDKPTGFRCIARDITERRKAEAEKKALEQRAQVAARLSTMGEMVSGIVHEINNPLTSVVGFAEILAQQDLPEDAREYAKIISDEGKRVTGIANRLLSFARHQKPETLYTDINKLLEDTIELQTYEMRTGNIKVTTELDPHLPQTMADPGQLQQVFLNIMLNARKEMRAAHGGGNLLVKTQALDGIIQISLEDDGPGIRQKNLERIFDPFFTTKKRREGTGLGLSICQGIINSHNGKIYARSTLGKGATFIIELPVVARRRKTTQAGSAIDKPRRPARVRR